MQQLLAVCFWTLLLVGHTPSKINSLELFFTGPAVFRPAASSAVSSFSRLDSDIQGRQSSAAYSTLVLLLSTYVLRTVLRSHYQSITVMRARTIVLAFILLVSKVSCLSYHVHGNLIVSGADSFSPYISSICFHLSSLLFVLKHIASNFCIGVVPSEIHLFVESS